MLIILGLSAVLALAVWKMRGGEQGKWFAALAFSLGCSVAILWGIHDAPHSRNALVFPGEVRLKSNQEVEQHFNELAKTSGLAVPNLIPTGVFIQSAQFLNPYTVWATGYVWQRLPVPLPKGVEAGVNFPEGAETNMTEYYRQKRKDPTTGKEVEVVGWYFETKLREQFDYQNYPFDRQNIWIRIWPKQFYANTKCIPDFGSYSRNEDMPGMLGIDRGIVIEGWGIDKSYYSFRNIKYDTDFGLDSVKSMNSYPELFFNIEVKREVSGPVISFLMPPFIVLLIIYAILVTYKTRDDRIGSVPDMATVLGSVAAMVFVLLVADDSARKAIETQSLTFTGILYCIAYLACILLTLYILTSAMILHDSKQELESRQDIKQLFWPVITFAIAVTIWRWL